MVSHDSAAFLLDGPVEAVYKEACFFYKAAIPHGYIQFFKLLNQPHSV